MAGDRFCAACGMPVPDAVEAELLADLQSVTLGEYDIIGILGRGGMGAVYLAHEIALGRKVAIKVLLPSLLRGPAAVERFRREARIAASFRHRHITSIFGLKETSRLHFFVMEYIEGRTLESILRDLGRLKPRLAAAILFDVAGALSYAHARDVTHRDIKPGNIIIDTDGMAVVTDFGVAKRSSIEGLTSTGGAVGSPKYMSPEQWSGQASQLSDQYALATVAYQMMTGKTPFQADTVEGLMKEQLFGTPQNIAKLCPACPPALASTLMRMLQSDPARRWSTLEEAMASSGLPAVGPDRVTRNALAELAKSGSEVRTLPKTPHSPVPYSRAAAVGATHRLTDKLREMLRSAIAQARRRPLPWLVAGLLALAVGGAWLVAGLGDGPPAAATSEVGEPSAGEPAGAGPTESRPATADPTSTADGEDADAGGPQRASLETPEPEPAAATGSGGDGNGAAEDPAAATLTNPNRGTRQRPPPRRTQPQRTVPRAEPGVLQILIVNSWANVRIDGRSRGQMSRGVDTLSSGTPHRIRFERSGFQTIDTLITLGPGEKRLLRVEMRQGNQ